jgi:sialic acid synthase SpsE/sugar phosphate isomerase/epimerase
MKSGVLQVLIERNLTRFVILAEDSVLAALNKISANKAGFVVAVSPSGRIAGVATDGDIRRWLTRGGTIDLEAPIGDVANVAFAKARLADAPADIMALFNDRVRAVPLLDDYDRLVAIALPRAKEISIAGRVIGKDQPAYVIAEVGNNHNGDVVLAKRLVDLAQEAGADCVKFQLRDLGSLYGGGVSTDADQDLGSQYTMDLLARFNLAPEALFEVFDHARTRGIEPLCTPWDLASLAALERYGVAGYKVASADLTNDELLAALAATGKPLICSTGMASESEIRQAVSLLAGRGVAFCLLHTNSTYPAPYKDVNLRYMERLGEIGGCPVGYSGHERGWAVPVAAVARGACVIEKHFTVDRGMEGNDHKVSLLPDEFAAMVQGIRATEASLGEGGPRAITQGEMMNREVLAKSLVAVRDIAPGTVITAEMVAVQSPGQGLQPNRRDVLIGRTIAREVKARTPFFPSDLVDAASGPRTYRFPRPWGLPVRWHDYRAMLAKTNLTLLEYHLSYKDLEVRLEDWFDEVLDIDFVVHAPELFSGDHVLDLASGDPEYLARSITEMQRVVDMTRALARWHRPQGAPRIIVNMGGFTQAGALPVSARGALYTRLEQSLAALDLDGVEIIPQTMPPFPWHFGGQSYHNLFIDADEIVDWCKRRSARICFDVSHSQLACNHAGWSMKEFTEKVGPYTAHLHIVDAKGVDGEGLPIGDGMIDFAALAEALDETCPDASFIPEIWQGHKDNGAGFWMALDQLEKWMGSRRSGRPAVGTPVRLAGAV